MELGLSLGDASKSFGFLTESNPSRQQQKPTIKKSSLDFCMALGINSGNQGLEKAQKSPENDDDDQISEGDGSDDDNERVASMENSPLQLNLLPLAPVPRQVSSHLLSLPWSSDNDHENHVIFFAGSSENGSSENIGLLAARGFNPNRLPAAAAAAEEVSSANSVGSLFQMDFGRYKINTGNGTLLGSNKRDFEATGNDVVEPERTSSRASDDDENGLNTRKKLRLSKEQSAFLEESFKEHNTLNPKQKLALAKQLNLRPRQIEVWFQNRRARTKLKQTEVDCEYLKGCCETLSEENRRLHKELQELRALKTSNPFSMQLPATTLTMCPSCERVATASTAPPPATTTTIAGAKISSNIDSSIPKAIPLPLLRPRFYPLTDSNPSPSACSLINGWKN